MTFDGSSTGSSSVCSSVAASGLSLTFDFKLLREGKVNSPAGLSFAGSATGSVCSEGCSLLLSLSFLALLLVSLTGSGRAVATFFFQHRRAV